LSINFLFSKNTYYIANVLLNDIEFKNWEQCRYETNKRLIRETKSTIPVVIGRNYSDSTKKYALHDGNHRCFCSAELGYTHIPAIISNKIKDDNFIKINSDKLSSYDSDSSNNSVDIDENE
jgi:hypothetical protein